MKKNFITNAILGVLFSGVLLSVHAQTPQGRPAFQAQLEGIWQLCTVKEVDGQAEMHIMPVLKIFFADGTYNTLLIRVTEGGTAISEKGTYNKTSDSVFAEKVLFSADSTRMNVEDNVTFKLKGHKWLVTEYQSKEGKTNEIWMRIDARQIRPSNLFGPGINGQTGQRLNPHMGKGPQVKRGNRSSSSSQTNPFQEEIQNAQQSIQDND